MNNLYWFRSIVFYSTTEMKSSFETLKIEARHFNIIEQSELSFNLKRILFSNDNQTIQVYLYASEQRNEIILFIQENPLKEKFIRYITTKPFAKKDFENDLFITKTDPLNIILTIENHFKSFENEDPQFLHIYGQQSWHQDAFIVGNRAALQQLYTAIGEALQHGEKREVFFPVDGEGYSLYISCVDNAFNFDEIEIPYHDPEIFEKRKPPVKAFKLYKIGE